MQTKFNLGYVPSLDGLRGFAVIVVLLFHVRWTPSGYHGVDVFFTLSGFLITCLLIQEWQATGSIDLKQFYFRRALRLLPALFAVLVTATLYEILFFPYPQVPHILTRDLMALSYLTNWFWALGAPIIPWDLSITSGASR
jgi:peptidoglycan/LPS O-acetylase OafA/YrhL